MARRSRRLPDLGRSGGFVGFCGLACVLFLDLASGGLFRWWAVAALVVLWLVLFALGCFWFTPRPRRVALLPVVGFLVWVAAVVVVVRTQ